MRMRVRQKYPFNFKLIFRRFWSTDDETDTLIPTGEKSSTGVPKNGKKHYLGCRAMARFSA